jgi:hypothetical protein
MLFERTREMPNKESTEKSAFPFLQGGRRAPTKVARPVLGGMATLSKSTFCGLQQSGSTS